MPLTRSPHYLRLLGSPMLEGPAGPAVPGRRLALLALLGSGGSHGLTRDKVIARLWPDQSEGVARHSLADVVYRLRRTLGDGAITSDGELLYLDRSRMAVDIREFGEAIERRDLQTAIDLYRGPFLDGFHLPGAPHEFETWVDRERARLALEYEKAVESLAEAAEARGDPVQAADSWRRLMRHDPANSRVALRLMHSLARAGDAANAIQFAEEHRRYLKDELDLDLPAELRECADALRIDPGAIGDREVLERPSVSRRAATHGRVPTESAGSPRSASSIMADWRRQALAVLVLLTVLAYAGWRMLRPGPGSAELPEIRSLAVLPLHDFSRDPEEEYLADGLTDALIGELGRIGSLDRVISLTTALHYRDDTRPLPEIARELNVNGIVEGSILRAGAQVRVTLRLFHAPTDRQLWSEEYVGELTELIPLQTQVSRSVAARTRLTLSAGEQERLVRKAYSPDPVAYEAYLKGKYHFNRWGLRDAPAAIAQYERAIELDPAFAPAHAALAEICVMSPVLGVPSSWAIDDCEAMAHRAIELDPDLAGPHAALALTRMLHWDWAGAEGEFRLAIELNPNAVTPHLWYALLLSEMMRLDEAMSEGMRAEELDPLNLMAKSVTAGALMNAHRYDEGLSKVDEVLALDPDYGMAYVYQSALFDLKGVPERGLEAARLAANRIGEDSWHVFSLEAWAYALMGEADQALRLISRLADQFDPARAAAPTALVYLALGREDEALNLLELAYREHVSWLPNMTSWPHFDALRGHPRFQAMRRGMGLE